MARSRGPSSIPGLHDMGPACPPPGADRAAWGAICAEAGDESATSKAALPSNKHLTILGGGRVSDAGGGQGVCIGPDLLGELADLIEADASIELIGHRFPAGLEAINHSPLA